MKNILQTFGQNACKHDLDEKFALNTQCTNRLKLYLVNTIDCNGCENPRVRAFLFPNFTYFFFLPVRSAKRSLDVTCYLELCSAT